MVVHDSIFISNLNHLIGVLLCRLKHGKLLRLNLQCDGSGPFNFCWSVKDPPYNVTGNETCLDSTETYDDCNIELVWYFRNNGTFDILAVVGSFSKIMLIESKSYRTICFQD